MNWRAVAAVTVLLAGLFAATGVTANESGPGIGFEEAHQNTDSVASALQVESGETRQYLFGGLVGAGIGLILGSVSVFKYWQRRLK